jgi:two-component system chemotaxis sensor kinase CheA
MGNPMTDPSKEFLQKLQATFRIEAEEHLAVIVSGIVQLEQASDGARKELADRVLKTLHTLKGAARAVNQSHLESLCHAMEGIFSALRASGHALAAGEFDLLHQAGTLAARLLEQPSGRTANQVEALINRLNQLSVRVPAGEPVADVAAAVAGADKTDAENPDTAQQEDEIERADGGAEALAAAKPDAAKADVIRVRGRSLDAIRYQAEELLSVELGLQHHIDDVLELAERIAAQRTEQQIAEAAPRHKTKRRQEARADSDVANRLKEEAASSESFEWQCRRIASALSRTRRQFGLTRSKLMDAMLETALVPFASALEQLPGLVRNLARSRAKQALLHIHNDSIQIDRRVLDIVREALIHLVTNAVDHGIEPVEQRLARGKPADGAIRIRVMQSGGGRVAVIVTDDGAGIDIAGLANAAIRDGSLKEAQISGLDDRQKLHLALQAGISTAAQVTPVSGRGMGLAIVAEKVASVGGDLTIDNMPGAGCTFKLLLPVRLSTLNGLVLQARGAQFVFPLSGLESVRALKEGDIETVENRETLLLAGRVVPVVRLGHLLGIGRADTARGGESIAVIARAAGSTFALLVDEIVSEQEVLPKSLGKQLRRVRCIAGATQLGDGMLVPILAPDDIARYGLGSGDTGTSEARSQISAVRTKRVLVVEDSITSRLLLKHILEGAGYQVDTAVDGLDALSRLRQEEFDAVVSDVEMPRMDGLALTERIRANQKTEDMPVILVTSLQSPEEKERGLRVGADAYVVKGSFDQDNLLKTIRRLI